MMKEATEVLFGQSREMRSEGKKLKRKRKGKEALMKLMTINSEFELDSSDSSENPSEEAIYMSLLRGETIKQSKDNYEPQQAVHQEAISAKPGLPTQEENKKLGAAMLLEEFQRQVGTKAGVVPCKCMGRCRDGPNVKGVEEVGWGSCSRSSSHWCGVGLDEISVIVADLSDGRSNKPHDQVPPPERP
ncbi:Diacylglycerol O-acyltransferase 3, cytosolic [Vitis vinifera]|uniref:Diacylglycerol O-acyltransferase 3, cytosolic n=1 Tax=Vitis vinifera TaxID=29760 RepID=A0A438C9T6_VITVI|nr:Diacylglycerol O-acyltransferase 3, cytosolic [Vitis vinifera]